MLEHAPGIQTSADVCSAVSFRIARASRRTFSNDIADRVGPDVTGSARGDGGRDRAASVSPARSWRVTSVAPGGEANASRARIVAASPSGHLVRHKSPMLVSPSVCVRSKPGQ
jgi:hypothetical protein